MNNKALKWRLGEIGWEAEDGMDNYYLLWGHAQSWRGPGWLVIWRLDIFNKDNISMLLSKHATIEKAEEEARDFHNALRGKP